MTYYLQRLRDGMISVLACASVLFNLMEPVAGQVIITEMMAVADEDLRDSDGAPSDWVELTNHGAQSVSLGGFHLTNSPSDLTRWTLPAEDLAAGESMVIFASGKNRTSGGAELHANFTLDRGGDYLALVEPDGITIASEIAPAYPEQFEHISHGLGRTVSAVEFVQVGAAATYLVPDADIGPTWRGLAFDDANWTAGHTALGYGYSSAVGDDIPVDGDVRSVMRNENASIYIRIPFEVADPAEVLNMTLKVKVDDGFVAYINGNQVAEKNAPDPLLHDSEATAREEVDVGEAFENFPLTFAGALVAGENILALQGLNESRGSSDFIIIPELVGEVQDLSAPPQLGYFETPTPGAPNGRTSQPPPADVEFSEAGHLFTEGFELALSCESPGAEIHYTTDLSVPTELSPMYSSPLQIDASTQVRARAFLPVALDGAVTTQTYLKMADDVAVFSSDLPVIVLSTLGTGSPPGTGATTRKAAYMFFFEPDPETGRTVLTEAPALTTRAGVRRRGSSSGQWPKYSLSVETWRDGDDEDRNIEPLGMDREADWILNARYEWDLALMRNPFVYEVSRQIGRYAPRTQFVEVFSDTTGTEISDVDYFGVYSLIERIEMDPNRVDIDRLMPWENAEPEITGGYIFKNDRPDPGEPTLSVGGMGQLTPVDPGGLQLSAQQRTWITGHLNELNTALTSPPSGINAATGLHFSDYIDVDSWIDHHLLNILVMNIDWGRHSAFFHKDRGGKIVSGPVWDYDRALGCEDVRDNEPRAWEGVVNAVGTVSSKTWFDSRYPWYGNLLGPTEEPSQANYPEIRQRHTDRWFELREREFSISNLHAIIDSMADEIRESQVRNFDRWTQYPPNGGNFADAGLTGWEAEVSHMKNWLETRANWVDEQYMAVPDLNTTGGIIAAGFELTMGSPDGQVFYTTDGTDPRASGGTPAANAIEFPGGAATEPVQVSQVITARTYDGSTWSAPKQVALVVSEDLADATNLVISEIMYHPVAPSAEEIAAGFDDQDQFEFLELLNISTSPVALIGMRFIAGVEFDFNDSPIILIQPGERALLVRDRAAFEHRYGAAFTDRIVGVFGGGTGLSNGGERLAINAFDGNAVRDFVYNDRAPWPTSPDGGGYSLSLIDPGSNPDHRIAANWRSSAGVGGTPGYSDSVNYAAWAAAFGQPEPGSDDDGDGRSALLEFASGGDPTLAEAASNTVRFDLGTVAFRRNLRASELTFELETSGDLISWQSAGGLWDLRARKI